MLQSRLALKSLSFYFSQFTCQSSYAHPKHNGDLNGKEAHHVTTERNSLKLGNVQFRDGIVLGLLRSPSAGYLLLWLTLFFYQLS